MKLEGMILHKREINYFKKTPCDVFLPPKHVQTKVAVTPVCFASTPSPWGVTESAENTPGTKSSQHPRHVKYKLLHLADCEMRPILVVACPGIRELHHLMFLDTKRNQLPKSHRGYT